MMMSLDRTLAWSLPVLFVFSVGAWGEPSTTTSPIELNVDLNTDAGPSPLAVSFSVVDTENHLGTTDTTGRTRHEDPSIDERIFTALFYQWDFDDPASGTWDTTGNSRNLMTGPLGAHVYEPSSFPDTCHNGNSCRKYNPTLTATDENGNTAAWTWEIQVYDPDTKEVGVTFGWGNAGETVCISRDTDHTGCPAAAAQKSTQVGNFQAILSTQIATGYRRILFHGGQTWTSSAQYNLSAAGPGLIGSYGGTNATINVSAATLNITGDDWRIQDLSITGSARTGSQFIRGPRQIKNLLVQRTTSANNVFTVSSSMTNLANHLYSGDDGDYHRDLFFVDNTWGYQGLMTFYGGGWGLHFLGNDFSAGAPNSHTLRVTTGRNVLVSNNDIGPSKHDGVNLAYRDAQHSSDGCAGTPLCDTPLQYYVTQDNNIKCNGRQCIAIGMHGTNSGPGSMAQYDFIFERNFFEAEFVTGKPQAAIVTVENQGLTHRMVIRNNILDLTGWEYIYGLFVGSGNEAYNNTCYTSDAVNDQYVRCIGSSSGVKCANNVLYAPNWLASGILVNCSGNGNIDNGTTHGGITSDPFDDDGTMDERDDFAPTVGGSLHDTGTDVPTVFDDALRKLRTGTFDAGAVER